MSEKTGIEVNRRRVLGGLVTIGAAGAAAGAGTFALFSDTGTSNDNTVQAGTLDLSFSSGGSFSLSTTLAPQESTSGSVTLVRSGTIAGSVDVDVSYTENSTTSPSSDPTASDIASDLTVSSLTYGGTDITNQLPASPTLDDLANNDPSANDGSISESENDLVNLGDPGTGGTAFAIEFTLADVGNNYQGQGVDVTFDFDLNQEDSQ